MDTEPKHVPPLPDGPTPRPGGSTSAQLKSDITTGKDRGRVMDSEHGLSQLGTGDEAGGDPASPELIDQMRQLEPNSDARSRNSPGRHDPNPKLPQLALLLTLAVAASLALIWFFLLRA